jgi:hypothetical protein
MLLGVASEQEGKETKMSLFEDIKQENLKDTILKRRAGEGHTPTLEEQLASEKKRKDAERNLNTSRARKKLEEFEPSLLSSYQEKQDLAKDRAAYLKENPETETLANQLSTEEIEEMGKKAPVKANLQERLESQQPLDLAAQGETPKPGLYSDKEAAKTQTEESKKTQQETDKLVKDITKGTTGSGKGAYEPIKDSDESDALGTESKFPSLEKRRQALLNQRQALLTAFENRATRDEWLEVAELFAKNLALYGAARAGEAKGVDMSGTKIEGTNWASKYDRNLKTLQTRLDSLKGEERSLEKAEDRLFEADRYDKRRQDRIEDQKELMKERAKYQRTGKPSKPFSQELAEYEAKLKAAEKIREPARIRAAHERFGDDMRQVWKDKRTDVDDKIDRTLQHYSTLPGATSESKDALEKRLRESKGWFSDDTSQMSSDVISAAMELKGPTMAAEAQTEPPPPPGTVMMKAPDGRTLHVPEDKVKEMEEAGATRI